MPHPLSGQNFFRAKNQQYSDYFMIGSGVLVFFLTLINGNVHLFSSAILLCILGGIGLARKNTPVLSFKDEHLELKLAPLAPKKFFRYNQITSVEQVSKKIIINILNEKPVKIYLNAFQKEQRQTVVDLLNSLNTQG
ncbi:hypothetical protein EDC44_13118 [Cricetibacter osteomyelitidis]|uniref:Uncharacterized protein n=1 Tax=Cricetibacter osteomyelitidis TaxID=1521931 RepID=A0A4R2T8T6_9PAST|nr:hypothetical protein [Cricetibacter osteomyelitidis]TCP91312.1 hypothetical protein EDC44_13118 [Cricetibacter osteomyelitidis]